MKLSQLAENSHRIHSRIYGLNTLGAFGGTLIAGLYIIPHLGYDMSLLLLGFLNVLVSLFYIKNNLSGPSYEKQKPEVLSHNSKLLYALSFVSGLTGLALEILWLGTFLGAIALGYLAFHIFNLKVIYLIGLDSTGFQEVKNAKPLTIARVGF